MKWKTLASLLVISLCFLVLPSAVYADEIPPLPHSFYGTVEVGGDPANVGTEVEARDTEVLTGIDGNPITVTPAGQYGGPGGLDPKLVVQGYISDGTPIEFYVDGAKAECFDVEAGGPWLDSYPFKSGDVTELNLRVGAAPAPTVAFSAATYSVGEDGGSTTITVNLSAASAETVTVHYATSDGTATAGADYTAASETLTFTPGDTSETFSVTILEDALVEGNETVNLALSDPSNATLGTPSTAALTIVDNDALPGALVADAGGPYTGTPGEPVSLSGSASGGTPPYSYAWDLDGNGTYETPGKDVSHTWATADTYTVGLKVTDDVGDIDTDTASVDISAAGPPPGVGGTAFPPNKLAILAPWIVLGLAVIVGATIFVRRRRARS